MPICVDYNILQVSATGFLGEAYNCPFLNIYVCDYRTLSHEKIRAELKIINLRMRAINNNGWPISLLTLDGYSSILYVKVTLRWIGEHFLINWLLFVESMKFISSLSYNLYLWPNFVLFINNVDWLRKLVVSKRTRVTHFLNPGWSFLYSKVTLRRIGEQKKFFSSIDCKLLLSNNVVEKKS